MAKHFFKTLLIFMVMIILGLAGVFLVSYFDKEECCATLDLPQRK